MTRIPVYRNIAQRLAVADLMLELVTRPNSPHVDALAPNQHDGHHALVTWGTGPGLRSWHVDEDGVITDLQTGEVSRP